LRLSDAGGVSAAGEGKKGGTAGVIKKKISREEKEQKKGTLGKKRKEN